MNPAANCGNSGSKYSSVGRVCVKGSARCRLEHGEHLIFLFRRADLNLNDDQSIVRVWCNDTAGPTLGSRKENHTSESVKYYDATNR